jgi:hypothetical protein
MGARPALLPRRVETLALLSLRDRASGFEE